MIPRMLHKRHPGKHHPPARQRPHQHLPKHRPRNDPARHCQRRLRTLKASVCVVPCLLGQRERDVAYVRGEGIDA